MNRENLEMEARDMSADDLRNALSWNEALAEHYDDNMDLTGYNIATLKIQVIKNELFKRGK